jgi:signal peptidase I
MPIATETSAACKLELAADLLRAGGEIRLQALGTSMLPAIRPGDLLTIEGKSVGQFVCGDIVLVARDNRFFIHRLIEQSNSRWLTRGDSLPQNDAPVASSQVLGKVSVIHRPTGDVIPSRRRSRPARLLAWMLSRSDVFRRFILRILVAPLSRTLATAGGIQALQEPQ